MTLADGTYISWFPKKQELVSEAYQNRTEQDDKQAEKVPEQDFNIVGLDQKKIADWWDAFKKTNTNWKYPDGPDCATVIEDALRSGGAAVPGTDVNTPALLLPTLNQLAQQPTTQP